MKNIILTDYGWKDPETGIEYATEEEAIQEATKRLDNINTDNEDELDKAITEAINDLGIDCSCLDDFLNGKSSTFKI